MPDVIITANPLPLSLFEGDLQETLALYAENLQGSLTGSVWRGQVGGTEPVSDVGPWLHSNGLIYIWNDDEAKYLPAPIAIGRIFTGSTVILTKFVATNTVDRMIYTPDKDGTMALTEDVFGESLTVTLTGASPSINWDDEVKNYYLVLSDDTLLSNSNMTDGQEREIWVEQPPGASYTFGIINGNFPLGTDLDTVPMGTTGGGNRLIEQFRMKRIGNYTFVERVTFEDNAVTGYSIAPTEGSGGDETAPEVDTLERTSTGTITITFDELLQATSGITADFEVKYNPPSSPKTISSATVSGNKVTLIISPSGTNTSSTVVTAQYTGSSVKDLAGNSAAVFGPSAVTYTSNQTGGSGGGGGGGGGGQNVP